LPAALEQFINKPDRLKHDLSRRDQTTIDIGAVAHQDSSVSGIAMSDAAQ
jgi:hypothetical protein